MIQKKLFLVLFMMIATLAFNACSDDKKDEPQSNSPYAKTIIGTWKITDYGSSRHWFSWPYQTTTATFNADGTYSGSGYFGYGSGTYKLVGSHITCYVNGKTYMQYDIISVNAGIAELEAYAGNSSDNAIGIRCKKQ